MALKYLKGHGFCTHGPFFTLSGERSTRVPGGIIVIIIGGEPDRSVDSQHSSISVSELKSLVNKNVFHYPFKGMNITVCRSSGDVVPGSFR